MNSDAGDTTQLVPGSPIRTPWDPRSVDNSPRPIAASHVLHRLPVPRHPPSALSNLTTKMLASTMQFSNNNPTTTHTHHPHPNPIPGQKRSLMADGTRQPKQQPPPTAGGGDPPPSGDEPPRLFFQDPTGCLQHHTPATGDHVPHPETGVVLAAIRAPRA